jgi:hypothetical protein
MPPRNLDNYFSVRVTEPTKLSGQVLQFPNLHNFFVSLFPALSVIYHSILQLKL